MPSPSYPDSREVASSDPDLRFVLAILLLGARYVLQLRDNKPGISAPGVWGLFGGRMEPGEQPEQALIREIQEELTIDLTNFRFLGDIDAFSAYAGRMARYSIFEAEISDLWTDHHLNEGQAVNAFEFEELVGIEIPPLIRGMLEQHHSCATDGDNRKIL